MQEITTRKDKVVMKSAKEIIGNGKKFIDTNNGVASLVGNTTTTLSDQKFAYALMGESRRKSLRSRSKPETPDNIANGQEEGESDN